MRRPKFTLQNSLSVKDDEVQLRALQSKTEDYYKKFYLSSFQNRQLFNYHKWLATNFPDKSVLDEQRKENLSFKYRPLISVLIPLYKTPINLLRECLNSVVDQSYANWQICAVDDCSGSPELVQVLAEYSKRYPDKFSYSTRGSNGHISKSSNDALRLAKGEYIALLDHDDVMWPNALYEIVKKLNENPTIDFIYTDEDKLEDGVVHAHPYQKPAYNDFFLKGCNYITHFAAIRTSLVQKIGGFRVGTEGAQDWDLFLRISRETDNIIHIPMITYSWRVIETSTAKGGFTAKPYAYEAQKKAIMDHYSDLDIDVISAELPHGYVGWMANFRIPKHISLTVIIKGLERAPDVATVITRVNDSNNLTAEINYFVIGKELEQRFKVTQQQLYENEKICFVKELTDVSLDSEYVMVMDEICDIQGENGWLNNMLGYAEMKNVQVVTAPIRQKSHMVVSAGVVYDTEERRTELLHNYLQGSDQRLDTNLLSPRSVQAPADQFSVCRSETFFEFLNSDSNDFSHYCFSKNLKVVYSPFANFFLERGGDQIMPDPLNISFSYNLPVNSKYWNTDTINAEV